MLGVVLFTLPEELVFGVVGENGLLLGLLLLLLGTLVGEALLIGVPLVDGAAIGFCDPDVGVDEGTEFRFGEVGL